MALTRAAQSGAAVEAERIDCAFGRLWALFREFGSFRVMLTIAEVLGYGRLTLPCPVLPLAEANRQRVELTLRSLLDAV